MGRAGAAALALAIAVAYGVSPTLRALAVAVPPRTGRDAAPADVGLAAEDVAFATARGETIRGWYAPGRNGALVVVAHGYGGSVADVLEPARRLHDDGYGVLAIDLAAHGRSGGTRLALDGRDVRAAVAFARARGAADGRIGLWGFSLGGMASLEAAAQEPAVGAVVADGPFPVVAGADMPPPRGLRDALWLPFDTVQRAVLRARGVAPAMGAIEALGRIAPRPVLLIAGMRNAGEGWVVPWYAAEAAGASAALSSSTGADASHVTPWRVPDAGHVEAYGVQREAYVNRVLALFEGALGGLAEMR